MPPKVTILMPLYNAEKYIAQSIESVLGQTYGNFELLIINDASTDKSVEIILSFNDPRIKIVNNESNKGSVYSRNKGISLIKSEYMAVLDSDDIFYKTKLEEQIKFMNSNTDFAVVGTWTEVINGDGNKTGVIWKNNISQAKLNLTLLFHNCFCHSSTLIRMKALEGKQYQSPDKDEDYDLWIQLRKDWKLWNIPKILTQYRIHSTNISKTATNKTYVFEEILKELKQLNIEISEEEKTIHRTNYIYQNPDIKDFITKRQNWLLKLTYANSITNYFPKKTFDGVLTERWLDSCYYNTYVGLWIWSQFWKSSLSNKVFSNQPIKIIKFLIRAILKKC